MAWVSPPTFVAGNVLSSAQLNLLSQDLEHLYGVVQGITTPFASVLSSVNCDLRYWFRYRHQYLHMRARAASGPIASISLTVNGTTVYSVGTQQPEGTVFAPVVNLASMGLAIGTWYEAKVLMNLVTPNWGSVALDYLLCSPSSTL